MRTWLGGVVLALALAAVACGGGSPAQPAPTPAPPPPPAAPVRAALAGTVSHERSEAPAGGARLEIVEGANLGANTTADAEGRYRLDNLALGAFTMRVQAAGFQTESLAVVLAGDQTLNIRLRPTPPPPSPGTAFNGLVVDSLSDRGLPGAVVRIDGIGETTTGDDGSFAFEASDPQQPRGVHITSPSTVARETRLRVPGPTATVSLIPTSFDLRAFDEMFRGSGHLVRWVSPPRLVIERRVLQFTDLSSMAYTATAGLLRDDEVAALVSDLEWALAQLTAGSFTRFAGVDVEAADEGASVPVSRSGSIVVARYEGLTTETKFWGYARWSWNGLGELQGAIVKLDRAFETSGSPFRRSLRAHELGHALGYYHVTTRDSVMQSHARTEPTVFDRDGARIAFQRPTRNRTPDADPDPFVGNLRALASQLFWAGSH
jgi:hypothetical protein